MHGNLELLLVLKTITLLNALGADVCVADPPAFDINILEYKACEEDFSSVTINCRIVPSFGVFEILDLTYLNCKFTRYVQGYGRFKISIKIMVDAKYSVHSRTLCKGNIEIWSLEQMVNQEKTSLKIPYNVAVLAFVCR